MAIPAINSDVSLGLLIAAGGRSSRMGRDKANLPWHNGTLLTNLLVRSLIIPFTDIIISANSPLDLHSLPGILSASASNNESAVTGCQPPLSQAALRILSPHGSPSFIWTLPDTTVRTITLVADRIANRGPLAGMDAGLRIGTCVWYLVLSVDLPFYDFSFVPICIDELSSITIPFTQSVDATGEQVDTIPSPTIFLPVVTGKEEPLAAIYHHSVLAPIQSLLISGNYRLRQLFSVCTVNRINESAHAVMYTNVNTPSAYKDARAYDANSHRAVSVVTIAASQSNTGKTTLIIQLIQELTRRGYSVGYIKSSHHDCYLEKEGSDTWRAAKAGAKSVVLCGPSTIPPGADKSRVLLSISQTCNTDIVFIESRNHGVFPIIEIRRRGYTDDPPQDTNDVVAIVSDMHEYGGTAIHAFPFSDINQISSYIIQALIHP